MKLGIKKDMDERAKQFYESHYDILPTPADDDYRFLKPNHGLVWWGNRKLKVCRFCGQKEPEVTFKTIAHALPQSIGNNALATYYECDSCNHTFGKTIENQYNLFFGLHHTIISTNGQKLKFKTPSPEKNYNENSVHWENSPLTGNDALVFRQASDNMYSVEDNAEDQIMTYKYKVPPFVPMDVFKCLVKMAISIVPQHEIDLVKDTITWLMDSSNSTFYSNSKRLLVRQEMIPGFDVTKYPHVMILKRKKHCSTLPYLLFSLTYGYLSFLLEIPTHKSIDCCITDKDFPFVPIPFYTSTKWTEDFTNSASVKGRIDHISFNYGHKEIIEPTVWVRSEKWTKEV